MSPRDDDLYEMSGVDERVGVAQFLTELRALADVPAPEPSAELAALLGGATPLGPRRRLRRAVVVRTLVVAAAVVAALVLAAAGHRLPAPAQRLVSTVVDTLTPFTIGPDGRHHAPAPVPLPSPAASDGADDPSATLHPPVTTHPSTHVPAGSSRPARSGDDGASDQPSSAPGGDDRSSSGAARDDTPSGSSGGDDGSEARPGPTLRSPTGSPSSERERERQAPRSGGPTEPSESPEPSDDR